MRRIALQLALIAFVAAGCGQGRGTGTTGSSSAKGTPGVDWYVQIGSKPVGGTITSDVGGINCGTGGSACGNKRFLWATTTVTLTATPDAGYTFRGWAGDCNGTGSTCTFTRNDGALDFIAIAAFDGVGTLPPPPPPDTTAGRVYGYVFDDQATPKAAGGVVLALRDTNPVNVKSFAVAAGGLAKAAGATVVTVTQPGHGLKVGDLYTVLPNELAANSDVAFKAGGYAVKAVLNANQFQYDDGARNPSAAGYVSAGAKTFTSALQAATSGSNGSYVFEIAPGAYSLTADDGNFPPKYTSAAAQTVTLPTIKDAGCNVGFYVPTAGVATAPGCLVKLANVTIPAVAGAIAPGKVTATSAGAATKYLVGFSHDGTTSAVALACTLPTGGSFLRWEQTAGPTALDTTGWTQTPTFTLATLAQIQAATVAADPVCVANPSDPSDPICTPSATCPNGAGSNTSTVSGVTVRNPAFGCGVSNFYFEGRTGFFSVNKQQMGELTYSFRGVATDVNSVPVAGSPSVQLAAFDSANLGTGNASFARTDGAPAGQPALVGPKYARAQIPAGVLVITDGAPGTSGWQLCTNSSASFTGTCTAPSPAIAVNDANTPNAWFIASWTPGTTYYLVNNKLPLVTNGPANIQIRPQPWGGVPNTCGGCHAPSDPANPSSPPLKAGAPTVQYNEWKGSKHNEILIDGGSGTHYSSSCLPCHTLGNDPAVVNGGWDEIAAAQTPAYKLPDFTFEGSDSQIFFKTMPAPVQAVSMVQCESCHGPAPIQATPASPGFGSASHTASLNSKVCAFCHDGGHHGLYSQWRQSAHADLATAQGEGPKHGRDQTHCGRCHFAQGFVEYVDQLKSGNPDKLGNPPPAGAPAGSITGPILCASYTTSVGDTCPTGQTTGLLTADNVEAISCQTCHDPHSLELRIKGDDTTSGLLVAGGFSIQNAGSGAICSVCHNSRNGIVGALSPNPNPGNASGAAYVGIAGQSMQHNDATPLTSDSRTIAAGTAPAAVFGMTGPHTASQADVYYGGNGYLLGQPAPTQPNFHKDPNWFKDTCAECHVKRFTAATEAAGTVVNHSFEVDDNTCASCHGAGSELTYRKSFVAGKLAAYEVSLANVLKGAGVTFVKTVKASATAPLTYTISGTTTTITTGTYSYNVPNGVTAGSVAVTGDRPLTLAITFSNGDVIPGCDVDQMKSGAEFTLFSLSGTVKTYGKVAKSMYDFALIENDHSSGVHNIPFVDAMLDAMVNHLDSPGLPK